MDDGWADGARYGGEHDKQRSLHEILLRRRAGVYRLGIEMERDKFEMNERRITIQFERDQQQGVKGFTLDAGRTRGMIFTRRNGAGKQEAR